MRIIAHSLTFNEENFMWFSLMSVVDYVDKILVWDTGSTDATVKIIQEVKKVKGEKIEFKEVGKCSPEELTKVRQEMLKSSDCNWVLVLDGDEVWWEKSIKKLVDFLEKNGSLDGVAVPFYNLVGDIYHYQDEKAGRYNILNRIGHLQLKAINRKIPELSIKGTYPLEGFYDSENQLIQESNKLKFLEAPYLHFSNLKRSSQLRKNNRSVKELGNKFSKDFKFPEVFYKNHPKFVPSPWRKITGIDLLFAYLLTLLRRIKRNVYEKDG